MDDLNELLAWLRKNVPEDELEIIHYWIREWELSDE